MLLSLDSLKWISAIGMFLTQLEKCQAELWLKPLNWK